MKTHLALIWTPLSARARAVALCALACASALAAHAQTPTQPSIVIDEDGTVHMPAQAVPISNFLSPEGKAYLAEHLALLRRPEMLVQEDGVPRLLVGYLDRSARRRLS
jgi:monoterpene epsilon-lactone hydrolase